MEKRIIVLTKSDKHSGFCVAGIDFDTGEWIRLVSSETNTEGAVPSNQMILDNGHMLEVYDIICVDLLQSVATVIQPENMLYNEIRKWKYIGKSNLKQILNIHGYDTPDYVFNDTATSLAADTVFNGSPSLYLLHINQANYFIKTFEKQKVQINFTYNGRYYKYFRVTQREIKEYFIGKPDGNYMIDSESIIFSLTDRYEGNGKYYKVVAQILE